MELNEYQERARSTAVYKNRNDLRQLLHEAITECLYGDHWSVSPPEAENIIIKKFKHIFDNYGLVYAVLGLVGEAGELANKLKKHLRNGTPVDGGVLSDELGDVMWYTGSIATELDRTLSLVAWENLQKLALRKSQDRLKEHPTDGA